MPVLIVIFAFPVLFPALIVHVPFAFPETDTIFLLLLTQDFTESPLANPDTTNFFVDCFRFNFKEDVFVEIVGFKVDPTTLVSSFPQRAQQRFLRFCMENICFCYGLPVTKLMSSCWNRFCFCLTTILAHICFRPILFAGCFFFCNLPIVCCFLNF